MKFEYNEIEIVEKKADTLFLTLTAKEARELCNALYKCEYDAKSIVTKLHAKLIQYYEEET